ncbi:uncharacterized protein LOC122863019 isoform X3, partial [Scomber scombrus]
SWRQFFVLETRKTNRAHLDLVKKIKGIGHIEVYDPEECDYLLVICPAVSQVGTYISEATESLPAGKPAILVVMHHTFNDFKVVVADSRRQVNNPNVYVTVDVLFYEKKLLDCDRNRIAWGEIQSFLVGSRVQVPRISWWNRVRSSDSSWRKFFVVESGKTNGAHLDLVKKIKGIGQSEVYRPEKCDYLLVFCPAVSRVGTNISEALESMPANKPAILVVMHHTFNDKQVVAESRRQVINRNVFLTVDVLFYDKKLLPSGRNHIAWYEIQSFLFSRQSLWDRIKGNWICFIVGSVFFLIVLKVYNVW